MKTIIINASPRKNGNTSTMLEYAEKGAIEAGSEVKVVNLADVKGTGCISCFLCKRKGVDNSICYVKDEIGELIAEIKECDVLVLATPIYMNNVNSNNMSLCERLLFSSFTYDTFGSTFKGKINTLLIYTMGAPIEVFSKSTTKLIINDQVNAFNLLNGTVETSFAYNTYQFSDYSKYNTAMFNEDKKKEIKEKQFPIECNDAYEKAKKLVLNAKK